MKPRRTRPPGGHKRKSPGGPAKDHKAKKIGQAKYNKNSDDREIHPGSVVSLVKLSSCAQHAQRAGLIFQISAVGITQWSRIYRLKRLGTLDSCEVCSEREAA